MAIFPRISGTGNCFQVGESPLGPGIRQLFQIALNFRILFFQLRDQTADEGDKPVLHIEVAIMEVACANEKRNQPNLRSFGV